MKPCVIIESPYAGPTITELYQHEKYLERCLYDSLMRGEAPFASHFIYPAVLRDALPEERRMGMEAGFAWGEKADYAAVYVDYGISSGMWDGIARHEKIMIVEYRIIGK
jgi:hypothetical protein